MQNSNDHDAADHHNNPGYYITCNHHDGPRYHLDVDEFDLHRPHRKHVYDIDEPCADDDCLRQHVHVVPCDNDT